MENRKGSGIFLGVIGVATLIVAIIGATFAFFGANAAGGEQAVAAQGAVLALGFHEELGGLKYNLIPADNDIAHYAATNEEHMAAKGECIDDNGNEVCGVYEFTIGNPSLTTQQGLFGNIKIASSDFVNLWFEILDETGATVVGPLSFTDEERNNGDGGGEKSPSDPPPCPGGAPGGGGSQSEDGAARLLRFEAPTWKPACTSKYPLSRM